MSRPRHIIVLNRWQERYAEYERYIDHTRNRVSYISTEIGLASVPPGAADTVVVAATDDLAPVRDAARRLAARHGAPDGVVALKEDDLLVGADLRAEWNCPGPTRAQVLPFRDKLIMARTVAAAGVAVPQFAPAPSRDAVVGFARRHGWPVVIKPRYGSSSEGVTIARGPRDIELPANAMVQVFNPGQIYHVDGVFTGRRLDIWRVCRYLNTCLEFRSGIALGAVQEDDPATVGRIGLFAEQALRALTDQPITLHLEVFLTEDRCAFLEVGARVGGGEIPFLWREVHGYDLMEAAFRISLGQQPQPAPAHRSTEITGELLAPAPATRPCRILEANSLLGSVPWLYAQAVLRPGEILPDAASYYEHVGGRFRFRGPTSAAVQQAMTTVARDFRIRAERLEEAA